MSPLLLIAMMICLIVCPDQSLADLYQYVKEDGSVCMTNSLTSVPKKYRKSMKVTKEEVAQKMLQPVEKIDKDPVTTETMGRESVDDGQGIPFRIAVRKHDTWQIIAVIVGFCIACYLVKRLTGALGAPRVGSLIILLALLLGGVYMYGRYVEEMRAVFGALRKDAMKIKQNIESRDKKSGEVFQLQTQE